MVTDDSTGAAGPHRARLVTTGVAAVIALAIPIGIYAFLFQAEITGDEAFHERFASTPVFAALHVIFGGLLLTIGGFQFVARIRMRHPDVHRWLGRVYLVAVLLGGIGGLGLATNAAGGHVAQWGFGLLAVVWLHSGFQAFRAIRRGDVQTHKIWMARNYALAFAAVTLRIQLGVFQAAGLSFEEAYPITAWLSWVPNLLFVEWFVHPRGRLEAAQSGARER